MLKTKWEISLNCITFLKTSDDVTKFHMCFSEEVEMNKTLVLHVNNEYLVYKTPP